MKHTSMAIGLLVVSFGCFPSRPHAESEMDASTIACSSDPPRGLICGTADRPCRVAIDETLFGSLAVREDPPGLALDCNGEPRLLYAGPGKQGYFATRDPQVGWRVSDAMTMTTGGLTTIGDRTVALVGHRQGFDPGAVAELWEKNEGSGWRFLKVAPGSGGRSNGIGASGGRVYASLAVNGTDQEDGTPFIGMTGDGEWTSQSVGDLTRSHSIAIEPPVSVSSSGEPHVVFWESDGAGDWSLNWASPPTSPERVLSLGHRVLDWQPISLAIVEPSAGVHQARVFASRAHSVTEWQYGTELVYAARTEAGTWQETRIATGDDNEFTFERCGPGAPSDCPWEYLTYRVVAMPATATDTHLLYARYRVWSDGVGSGGVDGRLEMAVVTDEDVTTSVLVDPITPLGGRAVIDSMGRIHLAVPDGVIAGQPSSIRYLRIEATNPVQAPN